MAIRTPAVLSHAPTRRRERVFVVNDPTAGDYGQLEIPDGGIVKKVSGVVQPSSATVTFNVEERTAPETSGTDVMSSDLVADEDEQVDSGPFDVVRLTDRRYLTFSISAVTSSPAPTQVTMRIEWEV